MAQEKEPIGKSRSEIIERSGRVGRNRAVGASTAERSQVNALLVSAGLTLGLLKGARVRTRLGGRQHQEVGGAESLVRARLRSREDQEASGRRNRVHFE